MKLNKTVNRYSSPKVFQNETRLSIIPVKPGVYAMIRNIYCKHGYFRMGKIS